MATPIPGVEITNSQQRESVGLHLRLHWAAYLILAVSLVMTLTLYLITTRQSRSRFNDRYLLSVNRTLDSVQQRFIHYLQVFKGIKGLVDTTHLVHHEDLELFLKSIEIGKDHPGLRDVGYVACLRPDQLESHVAYMRSIGFTRYTVQSNPDQEAYFPVQFRMTMGSNTPLDAVGWDAYADPRRRTALENARDTGHPSATRQIQLLPERQDSHPIKGFVVYLPCYQNGAMPDTLEQRRKLLAGYVFGTFQSRELWERILASNDGLDRLRMRVYDAKAPSNETLEYDSETEDVTAQHAPVYRKVFSYEELNRDWTFEFFSSPYRSSTANLLFPLFILVFGSIVTLVLFGVALAQSRQRHRAMSIAQDLKISEDALKTSESKFRAIFDSIQDVYYQSDLDSRIKVVSPACLPILGYSPEEVLGKKTIHFMVDTSKHTEIFGHLLECNSIADREIALRRKSGEIGVFSLNAQLLRDAHGTPIGSAGLLRDITERKRTEVVLRESQERLHLVISSAPLVLFTLDSGGNFTFSDGQSEFLLGSDGEELVGHSAFELFGDYPEIGLCIKRALNGEKFNATVALQDRFFESWFVPLVTLEGRISGMIGVAMDVTLRKRAEDALDSEKKKLEEERLKSSKLESIGVLAGGIAHDFNNLLTGIMGNISLARMPWTEQNEIQERLVDAEKSCWRAKDLTQQLLTFAKGGSPIKQSLRLDHFIKESTLAAIRGSRIICDFAIAADLWVIDADKRQLGQVVHNIASNADYAMAGKGKIEVKAQNVEVTSEMNLPLKPGRFIRVSFQDHGPGISPEHLSKVFDPYFTTKKTGSGLGLATAYSIIKRHEGLLCAESQPGNGARFDIYLPANEDVVETMRPRSISPKTGKNQKILVMDDEPLILNITRTLLQKTGYEVILASNGDEAVELYQESLSSPTPVVALILDLVISEGMGGQEALQKILAINPQVKAIVSSGYCNDPVMSEYEKHGFKAVISKPYELEHLLLVLEKVLST